MKKKGNDDGCKRTYFFSLLIISYFIAFGVILGGSLIGFGAFLIGKPALTYINQFAQNLRIWALVAQSAEHSIPFIALKEVSLAEI